MRQFIAAHAAWEMRANERVKTLRPGSAAYQSAVAQAEAEYEGLVSLLCAEAVVRQNISFGDDSMHDPGRESVESVSESASGAVVCTRNVGPHGFVSAYEYRLVREAGGWRIASILCLDADGGYECL
ncbi:MAG: hypothetical protein K8U57_02295 [Planctomycetes bacterium]|nr:hypothetical protein [Planctomycetota bacterium]